MPEEDRIPRNVALRADDNFQTPRPGIHQSRTAASKALSQETMIIKELRGLISDDLEKIQTLLFQLLVDNPQTAPFQTLAEARAHTPNKDLHGEKLLMKVATEWGRRITANTGHTSFVIPTEMAVPTIQKVFTTMDKIR